MNDDIKPELFNIRTTEGLEWVAAYRFGNMMVHRTHEGEGWTISHDLTGYRIPAIIGTRNDAFVAANEMNAKADWSILTMGNEGPNFGDNKQAYVKAAKEGLEKIEGWTQS